MSENKLENKENFEKFRQFKDWFVSATKTEKSTTLNCSCNFAQGDHVHLGAPVFRVCKEHQTQFRVFEHYYQDEVYFFLRRERSKIICGND